jgi:hypothetical protein
MEFFLGAFEREWERRRAALLHDIQMGRPTEVEWDLPRRGGVARLPDDDWGGARRQRGRGGSSAPGSNGGVRGLSMLSRFAALARGSQPAVVKLASYGGGARAVAMMSYASRNGELAVENESGERLAGKTALTEQRSEWEHLFDNRAASRDIGMFHVTIERASLAAGQGHDKLVREILRSGFGDRHFVYAFKEKGGGLEVRGVLVLRDRDGERLTGDVKASSIVQQRFDESDIGNAVDARFRFHGYGNGVEFGTARVLELVRPHEGEVRDDAGRSIESFEQARDLVQKEWRKDLHSRKGRDVMHLIVSARAGTDETAFQNAVRDFLGEQFVGHRYIFAMHDPFDDPKEIGQGGKRPHIHAHAIVTMRSETGERIETSPQMFREWRSLMAEKAREHGIAMELTDRRDLASPPAYTRNQVRPVSYAGRTELEGTSEFAQVRYEAKRSNRPQAARSDRSTEYAAEAAQAWRELAREDGGTSVADFAGSQIERIQTALRQCQIDVENANKGVATTNLSTNMVMLRELIGGEEAPMREMTRLEFEAYEKRVEAVLADVETSVRPSERRDFEEVAAAARDVVNIRREYLEFTEQQVNADVREPVRTASENPGQRDRVVTKQGREAVENHDDVMVEIEAARRSIDRAVEDGRDPENARYDLDREVDPGARLALAGNTWLREVAVSDRDLQTTIERIERLNRQSRTREDRPTDLEVTEPADATASTTSNSLTQRSSDGAPAAIGAEAEQVRDNTRHEETSRNSEGEQETQDDRSVLGDESLTSRDQERSGRQAERANSEATRSNPPQQHVSRLRELKREIEERNDRERDDHER